MKKIIGLLFGLCLIFGYYSLPGFAGDSAKWQEAVQQFKEKGAGSRTDLRSKLTGQVSDAIYPAVELDAAKLLVNQIKCEVDRGKKDIAGEPQIFYPVIEESVRGLRKISQPKGVEYLLQLVQDEKTFWRVRFYIIQALGAINTPEVAGALIKLIDNPNIPIKIVAFHSLAELKPPDAIERTCKLLNEPLTWEVKVAAVKYLDTVRAPELTELLIKVMQDETLEGRVRVDLADLLKKLTGADLGLDGKLWLDWLDKKKKAENPPPPPPPNETISIIPTVYYGITVTASRIIFIIDISDSMGQRATYEDDHYSKYDETEDNLKRVLSDPSASYTQSRKTANPEALSKLKGLKKKFDAKPVVNRLDAAGRELVNAIYHLDPNVEFGIIFFDATTRVWKDTLVPASIENKTAVFEYMLQKFGMGGGTAIYDGIELAFKFIAKEQNKTKVVQVNKDCVYINEFGGADTFFMVTDGAPTYGKITIKAQIVSEVKKIAQIRGVKVNTVAIGDPPLNPKTLSERMDVDIKFLTALAEGTGGVCKDKTSKKPAEPDAQKGKK